VQPLLLDRLAFARQQCEPHSCTIQAAGPSIAKLAFQSIPHPAQDFPVTRHRFAILAWLTCGLMLAGVTSVSAMPSPVEAGPAAVAADATADAKRLAQADPAQPPAPAAAPSPADPAADAQGANDEPIGNVATLTGSATVTRNNEATPLKLKDDIFLNDVLQTAANSSLGVTFNDATTFNLTANARIAIDNYVYQDGSRENAALFDVARGTVAFVAAAVAKTGDMKISTPTATLGIRGTSGLVEVPEGASATSRNNVAIKLYPDADGKVGRIEVNDRAGARLGFLTQGASGFTIRPGGGGARFAAVPLAISPQQAQRDQGFVRQAHSTQNLGRRVVSEQRAFRRANPGLNQNRGNQPRLPGQQRQNGLPQRPGTQQPGSPNRPGQQQPGVPNNRQGLQPRPGAPTTAPTQPGQPPRPGAPPRAGQPQQPGVPGQPAPQNRGDVPRQPNPQPGVPAQQPGLRQGAPGLQRPGPGLQNRPLLQRRPSVPAPKGKRPREIR
jgi:hypothetical protein